MKEYQLGGMLRLIFITPILFLAISSSGQTSNKDKKLVTDSKAAIKDFLHTDSAMKKLFDNSTGYVIFPNVGKGGLGVGGASGGGIVHEKAKIIGRAQMTQVTIGFQAGGQAYREVVFFENQEVLDRFKQNKIEFSAQVSAIAAKSGAAANGKFQDGVMVFTQQKGGLMYEASVGGQKFKYTAF